jgi:hypothetical protein
VIIYGGLIFLGSFLLFLVQPMIAKQILPWFGGSAAVWATCLVFFQTALLAGYAYADWTSRFLRPKRQAVLHIALLAASLLLLPIIPNVHWKPFGGENPSLRILGLLAATVGLPYLLLATTSPLVQTWFARRYRHATPYRLFALSNFAPGTLVLSICRRAMDCKHGSAEDLVDAVRDIRAAVRRNGVPRNPRQARGRIRARAGISFESPCPAADSLAPAAVASARCHEFLHAARRDEPHLPGRRRDSIPVDCAAGAVPA